MLPAAGNRYWEGGELEGRGYAGGCWSSSEFSGSMNAWTLGFISGFANTGYYYRRFGNSVRCVAE